MKKKPFIHPLARLAKEEKIAPKITSSTTGVKTFVIEKPVIIPEDISMRNFTKNCCQRRERCTCHYMTKSCPFLIRCRYEGACDLNIKNPDIIGCNDDSILKHIHITGYRAPVPCNHENSKDYIDFMEKCKPLLMKEKMKENAKAYFLKQLAKEARKKEVPKSNYFCYAYSNNFFKQLTNKNKNKKKSK